MRTLPRSRSARTLVFCALASACALLGAWVAMAAESRSTDLVSTGPAGGNGPYEANFAGASPSGSQVFFWTEEPLVAGDENLVRDLYRRAGGETTQISAGPTGSGATEGDFGATSADGSRVFFSTDAPLSEGDEDESVDVYERSGGDDMTLISTGAAVKTIEKDAAFAGSSSDGTRVFFETDEQLAAGDSDESVDVYERSGTTTTLISTGSEGEAGAGPHDAEFAAASSDGTRVFFVTTESLDPADEDNVDDLYERFGGVTSMVSVGGNETLGVGLVALSTDGTRVLMQTTAALLGADTDSQSDVYERFGGVTKLVSVGPTGGNAESFAAFEGASADATRVFFRSTEKLVEGDTDNAADVYERVGTLTTLISTGPAGGNEDGAHAVSLGLSETGDRVFFVTKEQLVEADVDSTQDLYERAGGETTLLSIGPAGGGSADLVTYRGNSVDGARAFFTTRESLLVADGDEEFDVYERHGGVTSLVSTGAEGGNGALPAFFAGSSADGSSVFFETEESLLGVDSDAARDVYGSTAAESPPEEPAPEELEPPASPADPESPPPAAIPRCAGKPATIVGSGKRDVIKGTRGRDVIVARGGNDKILARGGNDIVCAGSGKDTVLAGGGRDRAYGQGGNDRIFGQGGRDFLFGNGGGDLLNGGAHDKDSCRGGAGRDRLRRCELPRRRG